MYIVGTPGSRSGRSRWIAFSTSAATKRGWSTIVPAPRTLKFMIDVIA